MAGVINDAMASGAMPSMAASIRVRISATAPNTTPSPPAGTSIVRNGASNGTADSIRARTGGSADSERPAVATASATA